MQSTCLISRTVVPCLPLRGGLAQNRANRRQLRPQALLSKLFGGSDKGMGTGGSKAAGWQPAVAGQARKISQSGYDVAPMTTEERIAAAANLTDLQRHVTLQAGTERAFTGTTVDGTSHDNKRKGLYVSAVGGLPLFSSEGKYDSGTGWPSFFKPIDPEHVIEHSDSSIPFMPRVEVLCARSGAHLGHVFNDGPRPTGKRYCMNAAALRFIPEGEPLPAESLPVKK